MPFRLARRHTPPALPTRRRRIAVVRLGSRRGWRSGARGFLVGFLRRVRLRWLVVQYRKALKRVRVRYAKMMRDLIDGAATMETVHSRILTESYFPALVVPKPIVVASCPSYYKF